jgi:hypothetical protein
MAGIQLRYRIYRVITNLTWVQSVPPAVAGGCMRSYILANLACLRRTHPLPQVVLTVPKYESLKPCEFKNYGRF